MSGLGGVIAAAAEVEGFCRTQGWRFCFIGGLAVQRWGMPRFTQDVDLTLLTELGGEEPIVDAVLRRFQARLSDARQFALEHRVILARTAGGVDLDFALGAFPFEEECVDRATLWEISHGAAITTCSAEDLVILKVFAGRDRDWADAESVLERRHGQLDMKRIRRHLPELLELKDASESMEKLERMISDVERRLGGEDG